MKFTKTYNVQPNDAQRGALAIAYKSIVEYFLSKGAEVEVVVNDGADYVNTDQSGIIAELFVNGELQQFDTRYIGVRGGIQLI